MTEQAPAVFLILIGERILEHLDRLNQSAAWLAEKATVERSTISRILKGERKPTGDTLQRIAAAFEVSLAELVKGTDAADDVDKTGSSVDVSDYAQAVRKMIEYEVKAGDLSLQNKSLKDAAEADRQRARRLQEELDKQDVASARLREELRIAREAGARHEHDAKRFGEGLRRAEAQIQFLRAKIVELQEAVESGHRTTRIGAGLAALAAAASFATLMRSDDEDEPSPSPHTPNSTRPKKRKA